MNRIYKIIYSEARNGYMVVSELACRHGRSTRSGRAKAAMAAAVLTALVSFSWTGMTAEAAVQSEPLVVTKTGQTVTDDFKVENCSNRAVVEIASSAAKTTDDVTKVDTKSISATFSNKNEANGIWVQNNYPGTVNLADGLQITLTSDGNNYNTTGIYLEGVNTNTDSKGSHDESVNANDEFRANGNKISDTRVEVGNHTSITVKAGLEEDKIRDHIFAVGLENHFGHMKVGNDVTLSVKAGKFNKDKNTTYGFYQVFYGDTTIGDRLTSTVESTVDGNTKRLVISPLTSAHDHPTNNQVLALAHDQLTLGDDARLTSTVTATTETKANAKEQEIVQYGAYLSQTDYKIGRNMQIHATQTGVKGASNSEINGSIYTIGIYNDHGANGTIGAGLQDTVTVRDRAMGYVKGLYCGDGEVTLGDSSRITTRVENSNVFSDYGVHVRGTSKLTMGKDSLVSVSHQGGTTNTIRGAYVYPKSDFTAGDNFRMDVVYGATNLEGTAYGILNEGTVKLGKNAHITMTAPDEREGDTMAVYSYKNGQVTLDDGAVLTVNSQAENKDRIINTVVKADDAGKVTFDGGMTLSGSQDAIYSTGDGSSVTAMSAGRKVILGDLESADKGSINLKLNTEDSYMVGDLKSATGGSIKLDLNASNAFLRGKSTVGGFNVDTSVITELTLANGARWDMTGNSQVTTLNHSSSGTVNMAYNPSLQQLHVGTYTGKGGIFRMKSDLNDLEIDGSLYADKVNIDNAKEDSTGFIQVHDQSFLTGHEVTGTKYQLLITDKSGKATFSGLTLDDGGLWDVTPTIQNGQYVRDVMGVTDAKDTEWYLTKLEKKVNKDTIPLMKAADNSYALYRLDIDSLRKRMGDLRFRNMKDNSGIWARDFHGAYEGQGTDSRYNGFQLGYDYAANEKSLYGFFAERTISNPKYSYGSSKDHGLSGGLYGTWFGDSGVYTDVVAKWGRNDTELHTRGGWPDSANYRTRSESLSVEWGKTFTRDDGLFLEPEAQMVFGRLGSKDYTTSRGRTVHMGSYDSAIGCLGVLLGKRVTEGDHPYDYYLKFSLLHEFGGERNFHLAAPDGETMDYSENYRDTWQEAGFGGTWHINGNTSIYADAERSFNGSWHKKWQWNLGINWQF